MILGEYAVLNGNQSVVSAINLRIHVYLDEIQKRRDLEIDSNLGFYRSSLDNLEEDSRFEYIINAVCSISNNLPNGIKLTIRSSFSSKVGFGSSAAVTVAVHAALEKFINGKMPDPLLLYFKSLETIRFVQKWASGADIAASVYGGLLGYSNPGNNFFDEQKLENPEITNLDNKFPITAIYCGYKKSTKDVMNTAIKELNENDPEYMKEVAFFEINKCAKAGIISLKNDDLEEFGKVMIDQHSVMDLMGLNTYELEEIQSILEKDPNILGSKISGSGLGDCIVGIGQTSIWDDELNNLSITQEAYPLYELEIDDIGCYDEN